MLLHCAGPVAIEEYIYFVFNAGESNECYDDVCKKFKELREGARNVIYERLVFNQRNQKEGERIDNFVSELKRQKITGQKLPSFSGALPFTAAMSWSNFLTKVASRDFTILTHTVTGRTQELLLKEIFHIRHAGNSI